MSPWRGSGRPSATERGSGSGTSRAVNQTPSAAPPTRRARSVGRLEKGPRVPCGGGGAAGESKERREKGQGG